MNERPTIVDAIIAGIENSKFGKDKAHPDAPGNLTNFFTNVCNQEPAAYLKLLEKIDPNGSIRKRRASVPRNNSRTFAMSDNTEELEPKRLGPGPGRPPNALNKISRDLKEAIITGLVASDYAKDDDGKRSIQTYMRSVANRHPELFFQAVCKLIPKELRQSISTDTTFDITYHSVSEVKSAMLAEGMTPKQIEMLEAMLPVPLEPDDK